MSIAQLLIFLVTALVLGGVAFLIRKGRRSENPQQPSEPAQPTPPPNPTDPILSALRAGDNAAALKRYCEENQRNVQHARRAIKERYGFDV